jgi:hypothetical protein
VRASQASSDALGRLHSFDPPVEAPLSASETMEQSRVASRVLVGIKFVERVPQQTLAAAPIAAQHVRTGRQREQPRVIELTLLVAVGHARPQLERAFGQVGCLAVRASFAGGLGGQDRRAQRRGLIPGGGVMAGDHRRALDLAIVLAARSPLVVPREREVELAAFAGQQIIVERLAQ